MEPISRNVEILHAEFRTAEKNAERTALKT
jgi:hypothetical protein